MGKIRLFLDTNILIDYFSGRRGDGIAAKVMQLGRTGKYELCVSILTAANTIYCRKHFNPDFTPQDIGKVATILPMTETTWGKAKDCPVKDFEDGLQIACATENECLAIISRDHHYTESPLKTYEPEKFLSIVTKP